MKKILDIALIITSAGIFIIDFLLSSKFYGQAKLFIIPAILMSSIIVLCRYFKLQKGWIFSSIVFACMIYYRLIIPQIQKLFGI